MHKRMKFSWMLVVLLLTACTIAVPPTATSVPPGSGIRGKVLLGPTCPVERNPPDPNCADRPYQTTVIVIRAEDPTHIFLVTKSDASGIFAVSLPPGQYTLGAGEAKLLPRCDHPLVTVTQNMVASATIHCDTGIR